MTNLWEKGLTFYEEMALTLQMDGDHLVWEELKPAERLKRAALDAATCDPDLHGAAVMRFALWKGWEPNTGKPCNWLKLGDLNLILSNSDVALLRWLLLNYDQAQLHKIKSKKERASLTAKDRFAILARDKFTCKNCGRSPKTHRISLQVDHIIPVSKGGKAHPDNLVALCNRCNSGKSDDWHTGLIKMEYLIDPPREAFYWETEPFSKERESSQGYMMDFQKSKLTSYTTIIKQAKMRAWRTIGDILIALGELIQVNKDYGGSV